MNRLLKGLLTAGSILVLTSCSGALNNEQVEERAKSYDDAAVHEKYAAVKITENVVVGEHTGMYEDLKDAGVTPGETVSYLTEFHVISAEQIGQVEAGAAQGNVGASIKWEANGSKGLKLNVEAKTNTTSGDNYMNMSMKASLVISDEGLLSSGATEMSIDMRLSYAFDSTVIVNEGKLSYSETLTYEYLTQAEYDAIQDK